MLRTVQSVGNEFGVDGMDIPLFKGCLCMKKVSICWFKSNGLVQFLACGPSILTITKQYLVA